MKKVLVIKTFLIALCLGAIVNTSLAQNDADPALTSFSFAASPIVIGHTTTLTTFFVNNGFTTAIASGSVGLKLSLPTSGEYLANPETTAALSGTFVSKFTWTYNTSTKSFFGTSNQAIAPGDGGTIIVNVKGFVAVASAISIANIQRLNPAAYPNENVNNNNLTAALAVTPGGPTPVLLLNFNATKQISTVQLSWQTSSEVNSNYFDVQYSRDGNSWSSIGIVAAAGNSSTQKSYSLLHTSPKAGFNYYRLKQVDIGGDYVNSDTRVVEYTGGTKITISPNPVMDKLYITSNASTTFETISVFTSDGTQLQHYYKFVAGNSIDMSRYPAGSYMIKLTDSQGNTEIRSVVKAVF
jgi:hypothetical protein